MVFKSQINRKQAKTLKKKADKKRNAREQKGLFNVQLTKGEYVEPRKIRREQQKVDIKMAKKIKKETARFEKSNQMECEE